MFWKWYHFFQSFSDFSWKVFLEFCRFRYSNFAYDFFPGLYEFLKKRTTLTQRSRYPSRRPYLAAAQQNGPDPGLGQNQLVWDNWARFFCPVLPCGALPQILAFHSTSQSENSWAGEYFGVAPTLYRCKNVTSDRFTKNIYPITTTLPGILLLRSPGKITVLGRFRVFGAVSRTRGPKLEVAPT